MLYVEVVVLDEVDKSRLYRFLKYRLGDWARNRVSREERNLSLILKGITGLESKWTNIARKKSIFL